MEISRRILDCPEGGVVDNEFDGRPFEPSAMFFHRDLGDAGLECITLRRTSQDSPRLLTKGVRLTSPRPSFPTQSQATPCEPRSLPSFSVAHPFPLPRTPFLAEVV